MSVGDTFGEVQIIDNTPIGSLVRLRAGAGGTHLSLISRSVLIPHLSSKDSFAANFLAFLVRNVGQRLAAITAVCRRLLGVPPSYLPSLTPCSLLPHLTLYPPISLSTRSLPVSLSTHSLPVSLSTCSLPVSLSTHSLPVSLFQCWSFILLFRLLLNSMPRSRCQISALPQSRRYVPPTGFY